MAKLPPYLRVFLSAIAAFVGYGGWSLYINGDGDPMSAMSYALYYGTYSFIITLLTSGLMETLYYNLASHPKGKLITALTTCLLLYAGAWGVNYAAGTPNIVLTVLPGVAISTLFVISYVLTLAKKAKPNLSDN